MEEKRICAVISGRVQGVAFRANCRHQALARGVRGWVRNRGDGAVEALFEGPVDQVDAMLRWCHHGPPAAEVTEVAVTEAPPGPPLRAFNIRY